VSASLPISLADIVRAEARIRPYVSPTPLEPAPDLGPNVYLKLENTLPTHSFKLRGALNAALSLDEEARARGLIAASSGNHAQGLAYAAQVVGAQARIYMPTHTPQKKVAGVRRYGAQAVLYGDNYDTTEAEARRVARDEGLTYVSAYNDAQVMAGAGTIGLEIARALPDVGRVVVCLSGGGLLGGIALTIDALCPSAQIIGVNAHSAPAFYNLRYGTDLPQQWDTLAEALSGDIEPGSVTIPVVQALVDDIVLVTEAQIAAAMRWLLSVQGWLVEGGGAVGVAALLHDVLPTIPPVVPAVVPAGTSQDDARPTVVVISGANVDPETLRRIL